MLDSSLMHFSFTIQELAITIKIFTRPVACALCFVITSQQRSAVHQTGGDVPPENKFKTFIGLNMEFSYFYDVLSHYSVCYTGFFIKILTEICRHFYQYRTTPYIAHMTGGFSSPEAPASAPGGERPKLSAPAARRHQRSASAAAEVGPPDYICTLA